MDDKQVIKELEIISGYLKKAIDFHDRVYLDMADELVAELIKDLKKESE